MQVMGVTGKIYGLKVGQTNNGKDRVTFRVGVRKQYVSDQDKADGKTNVFLPIVAIGPTAKFIADYFKDGDSIAIGNMEYQTWRTQNAPNEFDDAHMFKANSVGFVGDNAGGGNNGNSANNNRQSSNNNRPADNNASRNRETVPPGPINTGYTADDDLPF